MIVGFVLSFRDAADAIDLLVAAYAEVYDRLGRYEP